MAAVSDKIVSLAEAREARQPHWTGTAYCVGCRNEWVAVAPMGVMWVDCPACGLPKGTPKHPFGADVGDRVLTCDICGSEALTAYYRGDAFYARCMGCGNDLTSAVLDG